jgi:hypothetical protein
MRRHSSQIYKRKDLDYKRPLKFSPSTANHRPRYAFPVPAAILVEMLLAEATTHRAKKKNSTHIVPLYRTPSKPMHNISLHSTYIYIYILPLQHNLNHKVDTNAILYFIFSSSIISSYPIIEYTKDVVMHTTHRHHTHTPTPNLSKQIEKIYRVLGFHLTSLRGDQNNHQRDLLG